jgi:hypothetical protein
VDSLAADSLERNSADAEAQRAARDAIMEIRLFPDLTVALRGALGYGPHVDMLQHFCYWMHPRHPKMQNRWTMYKTYEEWREECSLSDRQVRKGRKVLRELGLVTEKKTNYGRIDYRVDWVALAEALSLDTNTVQTDEDLDDFDLLDSDVSLDTNTVQGQSGRYSEESSLDAISVQANAEEHAGDYFQENTLLQRAPEPAFAEPGAADRNGKEEEKGGDISTISGKRHSQDSATPSENRLERRGMQTLSGDMKIKVYALVSGRGEEQVVRRFADNHIWNRSDSFGEPFTLERVAEKAREVLHGVQSLEAYVPYVERCIEDRLEEMSDVERVVLEKAA